MHASRVIALIGATATLIASVAMAEEPKRPRITGVAHMAIYVKDVDKTRAFYKDFLGYGEPFSLTKGASGGLHLTFIKISDRQYMEVFPEKEAGTDRLNHIALETDDAEAMRAYLASRGVKVPGKVGVGRIKNANFNIVDPDGHTVEIVQYMPDSWTVRENGKFLNEQRISSRMMHVGISVGKLAPAMKFYGDVLGFKEIWRGSSSGKTLNWVNMKVPDGDDYVEFMLYKGSPSMSRLGTMHHVCLEVPDIDKAKAELGSRAQRAGYAKDLEVKTGINRKRQLNLFDPDGTRIELMEPNTVDGAPAPPSPAPPPA